MSLFREYKDRRASAEGWPHYYTDANGEYVHYAKPQAKDLAEPIEKAEVITAEELELRRQRRLDQISLRDAGRR